MHALQNPLRLLPSDRGRFVAPKMSAAPLAPCQIAKTSRCLRGRIGDWGGQDAYCGQQQCSGPPQNTHVGSDSALPPLPPQCTEAGIVRTLTRRRDEGWGAREGGRDLLMHTHPVLGPSLALQNPRLLPEGQLNWGQRTMGAAGQQGNRV